MSTNTYLPPIQTNKDLTASLKSPANRLALAAVELIRSGGPIETLRDYIHQGLSYNYRERAGKARTKYYYKMILDACFESGFGVIKKEETATSTIATLGPTHQSAGREIYFDLLLSHGFPPGRNSWSGELFKHILSSCFYEQGSERLQSAIRFAKVLAKHLPEQIRWFSTHDYAWVGAPWKLQIMIDLGADPTTPWINPKVESDRGRSMIDCALAYVGCSPSGNDTEEGRFQVIHTLLDMGAIPTKKFTVGEHIGTHYGPSHHEIALEKSGLLERLKSLGCIEEFKKAA